MLESAFTLHNKVFIRNLNTVLLHAVLGTALNFLLVGGGLCIGNHNRPEAFEPFSQNTSQADIFLFSSLVSAVGMIIMFS